MTRRAAAAIRAAYLAGEPVEEIAHLAEVTVAETEIYLTAWCSEGCPEGGLP